MKSKLKVYLAGPINGCSDDECKYWREMVKQSIQDWGYEILDPMRRDYRGIEFENAAQIVADDLSDIQECDIMFAYCYKPSWGTAMEIFYAKSLGKRVIVVTESSSPWLQTYSDVSVKSVHTAIKLLLEDQ